MVPCATVSYYMLCPRCKGRARVLRTTRTKSCPVLVKRRVACLSCGSMFTEYQDENGSRGLRVPVGQDPSFISKTPPTVLTTANRIRPKGQSNKP